MDNQVQDFLDNVIVNRESDSLWNSPAILVPKKSMDEKKWHMCIYFRTLYTVTKVQVSRCPGSKIRFNAYMAADFSRS